MAVFELNRKSLTLLIGVHKDAVRVVKRAAEICSVEFQVGEGLRSVARQRQLVAKKKSWTMRSRHIYGFAIDLWAYPNGKLSWDWVHYHKIAAAMKAAAEELGIDIEWGGDWKTVKDGPHFQLPHKKYPDPSYAAYNPSSHALRRGSSGPYVAKVQAIIGVKADGKFGRKTERALKKWQSAEGMSPDGIVGPLTKERMGI